MVIRVFGRGKQNEREEETREERKRRRLENLYFPTAFFIDLVLYRSKWKKKKKKKKNKRRRGENGVVLFELDFILRHSTASELPVFHFRPMIVHRMNILSLAIHKPENRVDTDDGRRKRRPFIRFVSRNYQPLTPPQVG